MLFRGSVFKQAHSMNKNFFKKALLGLIIIGGSYALSIQEC